jgi:proline iminopeptidase
MGIRDTRLSHHLVSPAPTFLHFEGPHPHPADRSHGGPGGGTSSSDTIYFNPDVYRIVLIDQRGAGKSEP